MKIKLQIISKDKNKTETLPREGVYFVSSNGNLTSSMSDLTSNFLLIIEYKDKSINISGVGESTFLSSGMKKNNQLVLTADEIIYTQNFQIEFNFLIQQSETEQINSSIPELESIELPSLPSVVSQTIETKPDLSLPSFPIDDLDVEQTETILKTPEVEEILDAEKKVETTLSPQLEVERDIVDASLPKISIDELLEQQAPSEVVVAPFSEVIIEHPAEQSVTQDRRIVFLDTERDDFIFSERKKTNNTAIGYKNCESIAEGFIDIYDQEKEIKTNRKLFTNSNKKGLKVQHLHNGVVISERFFLKGEKKIYISAFKESRKIFQMYDFPIEKKELLAYFKGSDLYAHRLDGFHITDKNGNTTVSSNEFLKISSDKPLILTKGLSQLFLNFTDAPPILNNHSEDQVDEGLIKTLIKTWAVALIPLIIMFFLVDIPEKKQEEEKIKPVVIHRKKKMVIPKKKEMPKAETKVANAAAAASSATAPKAVQEPKKQDQPPKKVVKKEKVIKPIEKVVLKSKPKKMPNKVVKKAPSPVVTKKIVSKKAKKFAVKANKVPQKPKKRSFSFSSTSKSKLKSVTRSTASLNQRVKGQLKTSIGALGTINNGPRFNANDVGVNTSITVGKLKTKGSFGRGNSGSAKGLSSKSSGMTAYSQATTKVLGAIDPELIRKILREYIPQFRHCYQRDLKGNPKLKGVFDLVFQINGSGRGVNTVIKVNDSNSFSSSGKGCLAKVITLIQFPKPKGGGIVDVRQPMDFHSN